MADQEQNQLLLNAIKNKFSAQNAEEGSNCSTGFFIPTLKTNPTTTGGAFRNFTIPNLNAQPSQLQIPAVTNNGIKFTLPTLKAQSDENNRSLQNLTKRLDELHVAKEELSFYGKTKETVTSPKIDLTTALSTPHEIQRRRKAEIVKVEKFDIPFIDCDKRAKKTTEVKEIKPAKTKTAVLRKSSDFGRLMSLKYTDTVYLHATINHEFSKKYNIQPFKFDTKSPDDIVLAMLNKIPRRT